MQGQQVVLMKMDIRVSCALRNEKLLLMKHLSL